MNALDFAFLVTMLYGLYKGYNGGFIGSMWGIIKAFLAVILAARFYLIPQKILTNLLFVDSLIAPFLGFAAIIGICYFTYFIISCALNAFVPAVHSSSMSRGIGILVWAILLSLGFSFGILFADGANMLTEKVKKESSVFEFVEPLSKVAVCNLGFVSSAIQSVLYSMGDAGKRALKNAQSCYGETVVVNPQQTTQEQ